MTKAFSKDLEWVGDLYIDRNKFWSYVAIKSDAECWPWLQALHRQGYGFFNTRDGNMERKMTTAHRVAWRLHHNTALTADTKIIHTCNNPRCCNPLHLTVGTTIGDVIRVKKQGGHYDNRKPMKPYGDLHPQAARTYIFTVEQLVYARYHTPTQIMDRFGFTRQHAFNCRKKASRRSGYGWLELIVDNYDTEGHLLPGKSITFPFEEQIGTGNYLFDDIGGF